MESVNLHDLVNGLMNMPADSLMCIAGDLTYVLRKSLKESPRNRWGKGLRRLCPEHRAWVACLSSVRSAVRRVADSAELLLGRIGDRHRESRA